MAIKNTSEQVSLDFGFEAEYSEFDGYTTITGKEQKDLPKENGATLDEFAPGTEIDGYPEVTIFDNNDKNGDGEYKKKYQSVRIRLIDDDEYVDLYSNIPRRTSDGFISNLNEGFDFFRTGFDLVFSFMRFLDETSVLDENGRINRIKKVNIENICKSIDGYDRVSVRVTNGADNGYNSFVILNME